MRNLGAAILVWDYTHGRCRRAVLLTSQSLVLLDNVVIQVANFFQFPLYLIFFLCEYSCLLSIYNKGASLVNTIIMRTW